MWVELERVAKPKSNIIAFTLSFLILSLFKFMTPTFLIRGVVPLYIAWFIFMIRFYLLPVLLGYGEMGMLSFPLESEIAQEIYRLFGKN